VELGDERLSEVFNRALLLTMTARFLESEYGEGALEALADWKEARSRERWRRISEETGRSDPEYLLRLFTERVHEFEVVRCDREALEVRVTRCAHADAFRRLGSPEVGHRMICMGDHAVVEGFNPGIRFSRPGTLMEGGCCCHFRFELD
jgi:predicted ArsR family transcriptional regulator